MDENKQEVDNPKKIIRTYTSDMAEAIHQNEGSVIKIALAEKEKREGENDYQKKDGSKTSKILFLILGILLIGGSIFGLIYIKNKQEKKQDPVVEKDPFTFISYETKSYIDLSDNTSILDLSNLFFEKNREEQIGNSIKAFFLRRQIGESLEQISVRDLLSIMRTTAPSALIRSLSENYMIGSHKKETESKSDLFIILETNDYNIAYASMLEWERTLLNDMVALFEIPITNEDRNIFEKLWKDIIISNRDVRVLYDNQNNGILYYTFLNKKNLLITNNPETIKDIISRFLIKGL